MKPLLLLCLFFLSHTVLAQSLDYISIRKQNNRVVKNFYTGSAMLMQLTDGSYLQGPVQTIKNDSVYVVVFDIRYYRTNFGTLMRDTVSKSSVGVYYKNIKRIYLNRRQGFFQRSIGPLLKIGSAGYLALNILNGDLFRPSLTGNKNLRKIGYSVSAFGLGFLLNKWFATDGFSKPKEKIVYVDL